MQDWGKSWRSWYWRENLDPRRKPESREPIARPPSTSRTPKRAWMTSPDTLHPLTSFLNLHRLQAEETKKEENPLGCGKTGVFPASTFCLSTYLLSQACVHLSQPLSEIPRPAALGLIPFSSSPSFTSSSPQKRKTHSGYPVNTPCPPTALITLFPDLLAS